MTSGEKGTVTRTNCDLPICWVALSIGHHRNSGETTGHDRVTPLQNSTMEGRYRLLVDANSDDAIYMLDPDGYVSSCNSGA